MSTSTSDQPSKTWRSPFTGEDIDAHLVRREVAVNLAVKNYVFRLFNLPEPKWQLTSSGLSYKNTVPPIVGVIPYPPELAEYIAEGFMVEYSMAREHLGLPNEGLDDQMPPPPVSGENRGSLLRHMNAAALLLHFASLGVKWPDSQILALHGSIDLELPTKLREAGIYHILVWSEEHLNGAHGTPEDLRTFLGTGTLQLVTIDAAATLARDAYAQRSDRICEILHLRQAWEFDSWSGFHPMFSPPK